MTKIEDLELTGSGNMKRSLERQKKRVEKRLTPSNRERLAKIDQLIDEQMGECECGGSIGEAEKRNPAFANLESLMRTRKMLLKEEPSETEEESVEDLLREANKIGKRAVQ